MPASMISADSGLRLKVIGSSMAMVATGPMPGRTPIRVPRMQPTKAYKRFCSVSATPKPIHRLAKTSMRAPLAVGRRPERERQRQALHEHQPGEEDQDHVEDRYF